ncbi:MAG: glycosyltransferase family 4 protein [Chlamydiota bacterium]
MEYHENAFPHMLPVRNTPRHKLKQRSQWLLNHLDLSILTNYAQEIILKKEFSSFGKYVVIPNGAEVECFQGASSSRNETVYPLTYTGQFTAWKNIRLLFQALQLLDKRFYLRIAGGKGDEHSKTIITNLAQEYGVEDRIEYFGFVSPEKLVSTVIEGSAALLLPLGDNIESRYFTSPLKLFEYLATDIPIVAVDMPTIRMITGTDLIYLSSLDPKDFARNIERAVQDQSSNRYERRHRVAQKYSYLQRSEKLDAVLGED